MKRLFLPAAVVLAAALGLPAGAGEPSPKRVQDLEGRVLDIVARVDSQGGTLSQTESSTRVRITLDADVLFAFDSARLTPRARRILAEAAGTIRRRAGSVVRIDGHTDSKGSPTYNQRLSERRAAAVRRALATSVAGARFAVRGYGERRPVAPNTKPNGADNPQGRRRNRRVEIRFDKG